MRNLLEKVFAEAPTVMFIHVLRAEVETVVSKELGANWRDKQGDR